MRRIVGAYVFHCPEGYVTVTADSVFEEDKRPIPTGILNEDGIPFYMVPDSLPLGFDLTKKGA